MKTIIKQLTEMKDELRQPFPTEDINKISEDFRTEFLNLSNEEEVDFYEDFRFYCSNIAGTLSYVLEGKINQIPEGQIDMLYKSFFEYYNQYEFLEDKIAHYNHFFQEFKINEQARKWLLQLLSNNHYPLKQQSLYTKINLNNEK
ncbi:YxiJ-like family protein [Lysinibacillus sp. CD3-6]|uniref:YxiJ family protein n=1 Tax=Lysinibacillus sp. CD3-6 TaxID=2892541 RepID=UPI00116E5F8D|nr:YxiJ family protein [Lysinibacillus sp. CD3-6]UED78446.1 YxiJ-like family protein [Lysinibacillus sp. CD3-6]